MNKKNRAPISARPTAFRRIGQIVGAFGIKGHVKVDPLTDFWERFEPGTSLLLEGEFITIEDAREHKDRLVLKLSGIDTPDQAQAVQFKYLEGDADFEPELDRDEYMTADLIGMKVVLVDGKELGEVDNVVASPAHDILVVGEILIPAVKQFVKKVDLKNRKMTVELIEGMLPEGE